MRAVGVAAVALAGLLVTASLSFALTPAGGRPEPVEFDRTIETGLTSTAVQRAEAVGWGVPRVQVFYAGYRYVLGYYGVESFASALASPEQRRQFGRPLAAFVTDFAGVDVRLEDGNLAVPQGRLLGWVPASEAVYVVDSGAGVLGTPVAVPFSERAAAEAFVAEYGGEVLDWDAARRRLAGDDGATLRERSDRVVAERSEWADGAVDRTAGLLDRPVSVRVEPNESLAAALARAPPNTTVRLAPGTHRAANLTVGKPLTVAGAGPDTRLVGPGNGSVLQVRAPRVAVANLSIAGVGDRGRRRNPANASGEWDAAVVAAYGYGDAAVVVDRAPGSLVAGVRITTPANGVIVRDSDGTVVRGSRVDGSEEWLDGYMGVVAMRSRVAVQDLAVEGGRDGVYTHRADGLVVRDSRFRDMRFGVHEMYTSDALLANNSVTGTQIGLVVMTRPAGNALVGNEVRDSDVGLSVSGSASFVVGNVLVGNDDGLYVSSQRSLYARNAVVHNGLGVRADTVVPTNRVVANDVVANDRRVEATLGPVRVWSSAADGNYWGPVPALDRDGDGLVDRAFRPSDPVDRRVGRTPGATTLARSPAVSLLRGLEGALPGLRASGVVDEHPRAAPTRPAVLRRENVTLEGAP